MTYTKTFNEMFDDPCFWCHKNHCQDDHVFEMELYRKHLHNRAVARIFVPKRKAKVVKVSKPKPQALPEAIESFLSLPPEQLSMEDHRLKAHFLRLKKTLPTEEAWKEAKRQAHKESTNHLVFWNRKEWANIKNYKLKKKTAP